MDRFERLGVKKELTMVWRSIDIYWRQRAKQQWIENGDRNTKFFHQVEIGERKFNAIHKIKVNDELYVDAASVNNAIVHFYENLYHEDQPSRIFLNGITFASISLHAARDPEKDFTEDEVWNAISELGNKKAPGPNGFNIAFVQHW